MSTGCQKDRKTCGQTSGQTDRKTDRLFSLPGSLALGDTIFFPHSRWHGPILITFFCTNFLSKGDRRNEVSRWHGPSLIIFFCANSLTQGDRRIFHWNFYEIWVSPSARDPGNCDYNFDWFDFDLVSTVCALQKNTTWSSIYLLKNISHFLIHILS